MPEQKNSTEKKQKRQYNKSGYELCDFCHKARCSCELEKITVTYYRCKDCSEKEMQVTQREDISIGPAGITRKPMKTVPPPYLAEAFRPPAELEQALPSITPTKENIEKDNKSVETKE